MLENLLSFWWLAGAILIGLAVPLAAVMIVIDHRRHRSWPNTGLAVLWCALTLAIAGIVRGNLSPPLFGVPLVLLLSLGWSRRKSWFVAGVTTGYCLVAAVVIVVAFRRPNDVNGWLLLAAPTSLIALTLWRTRRQR
ncbi:MAG: hypothetical protein IT361_02510 [Gemmatimonadaceae bacterium]|nr:hypothetical protein [Gemmatimonadaceae bacterium]